VRRALLILLSLCVLSTALNLVVTGLLTWWFRFPKPSQAMNVESVTVEIGDGLYMTGPRYRALGGVRYEFLEFSILPPKTIHQELSWLHRGTFAGWRQPRLDLRGWPSHAFWCGVDHVDGVPHVIGGVGIAEAAKVGRAPAADRRMPWRPIWRGVLINSGFYAAVLAAAAFGPKGVRRLTRPMRGHCAGCGYDLRAAPATTCPECGRPVSHRG
jgi:hypothetical protein